MDRRRSQDLAALIVTVVGGNAPSLRALKALAACYEAFRAAEEAEAPAKAGPLSLAALAAVEQARLLVHRRLEAQGFQGDEADLLARLRRIYGVSGVHAAPCQLHRGPCRCGLPNEAEEG